MDKYLEPIREKIKTNKRKIIKRASIGVAIIAGLGIAAFTTVYSIAKSNINYTVEEAKAIVLQSVQGEIVRVKRFNIKPMSAEEAILQMELVEHNFFVFKDCDTENINVIYKRKDGNYGLLEPDYI